MPSKKKKYSARFPPARIKKIMQTDEDVGKVAAAVPVVISRALEFFIESLILKSADHTKARNAKTLSASHIKQIILSEKKFDFLKDLVANIPDVQANEEEETTSDHPPPPKPRTKPPPVPGQAPRPRGRPKKKRDGEVIPAATPVKRRHSDEEEHKDTESEETNSDLEDSDTAGDSALPTESSLPMPSFYQEQSLPGTSEENAEPTFHNLMPAAMPVTADSVASTVSNLPSSMGSQELFAPTNVIKCNSTDIGQTQQHGVTPTQLLSSLQSTDMSHSTGAALHPQSNAVKVTSPQQTLDTSVSNEFSGFKEHSVTHLSLGMPHLQHPQDNAETSGNSGVASLIGDSSRTLYQQTTSAINETIVEPQKIGNSKALGISTSNTAAGFLKEEVRQHCNARQSDTSVRLPPSFDVKPSVYGGAVQNGDSTVSGQEKAMHSHPLQLDTKLKQETFEKWSPTKAGVLDLSVSKRNKEEEATTKAETKLGNQPLNLATNQEYTKNSKDLLRRDTAIKSHVKSGDEVNKPVIGHNDQIKDTRHPSSCPSSVNLEKSQVTSGVDMPGYHPPMMGLQGYPGMTGFPPYGMMPQFNGPNQFGVAPGMLPLHPYASTSGFYLPYQGPMMGYPPATQSENNPTQQQETAVTKPS